jgi:hypothetical protein
MRSSISKGLLTAAAAATGVLSLSGGYAQATDATGTTAGSPGVLSGNNVQAPVDVPVNLCGNTIDPVGILNPAFGNACANTSGTGTLASAHTPAASSTAAHPMPATKPAPRPEAGTGQSVPRHPSAPSRQTTHDTLGHAHGAHAGHAGAQQPAGVPHVHGADATGAASDSPGVLSGNLAQLPIDVPVNACGNSLDVVGLLNPAFGNTCVNEGTLPPPPRQEVTPPPAGHSVPPTPPLRSTPPPAHVPSVPVVHHHTPAEPPAAPQTAQTPPQLAETGADANLLAAGALSAGLMLGGAILYRRAAVAARA